MSETETISVRGLPSGTLAKIDAKANAAGKSREAWLREQIESIVEGPIVRERYAYRFAGPNEARGVIRRESNHPNGIGGSCQGLDEGQMDVYRKARDIIRRNEPGDRETAYDLLKSAFTDVFEVP